MMDGYWRQIMERRAQAQRTLENQQTLVNSPGGREMPDATQLAQSPAQKDKEDMIWKAVKSASGAL